MKRLILLAGFVFCFHLFGSAQKVSGVVRGTLQDSVSATPLNDATVSVINSSDSSLISFTLTSSSGFFQVKNLDAGQYHIAVSFSGFRTLKKSFAISAANPEYDFGVLKMDRNYKTLEEVVVEDAPIKVKGDTISFKADAFKTKPNATVEDLLKKLPGVAVEKDGTVKAQGENVQKVYVDGKEFFGNDPKLATKNLTAEMVDRVDVFDDQSEQAKFSGIEDGSRSKAINLKLKKDKKKGVFGKAYAGAGTNDRYDAGVNANFFKGATQASVIAKSNNTNNVGFSLQDMMGMFSGGGMGGAMMAMGGGGMSFGGDRGGMGGMGGGMMMGGGAMGGFNLGNTGRGITSSSQAGINYRDTWSKVFDVNGSYFFNHTLTENNRNSFRQTLAPDSSLHTTDNLLSHSRNDNHRINFNMVMTLDSFNSIIYTPGVSFQKSQTFSDDTLSANAVKDGSTYKTNESRTINDNKGDGYTWNNNLIWRKKFRKAGRTFSVNLNNTISQNERNGYSTINSSFFRNNGEKWFVRNNNYLNATDGATNNYGVALSYTEPIARDKVWEINYRRNNNSNSSDRTTSNFNPATGQYDRIVDSLSNETRAGNLSDRIGTNLRVVKKKYNYQLGFAMQQTTLETNNISKGRNLSSKFTNFFPTAAFTYQFARSRTLRLNYNGRTNAPTATQLQEVSEIFNYPYIYRGNAALRQEFTHSLNLSYNYFDMVSFRNLFAFVTFSNTQNKISNSVEQLPGGVQLTTPINLNGVYFASGNFNIGFPVKALKGANINTTTRINYSQDANMINQVKNFTRNLSVGEDLRLNYNYKDKLDLGVTASINYNSVTYTFQSGNNNSYYTHNYSADATYTFPKGFIVATDFDYFFNTGRAAGFNQNYALWNASVAKQLFKNKRGEVKASVFDILNQNTSVVRNIGSNYIEDVQNSVLNRFFMLTLTYNINRMGGRTMPAMMERATRGIRF